MNSLGSPIGLSESASSIGAGSSGGLSRMGNGSGTSTAATTRLGSSHSSIGGQRSPTHNRKRNSSIAGLEQASPGDGSLDLDDRSPDEDALDEEGLGKKRTPGVKRACNECRQQKLRCDVVRDPFQSCARCKRLRLECKIDSNFKRIGKRCKNAEMEREIIELRRQLQAVQQGSPNGTQSLSMMGNGAAMAYGAGSKTEPYLSSHDAVTSLLDLQRGYDTTNGYISNGTDGTGAIRLDPVTLTPAAVTKLFALYFEFYHPFLPLLDRFKSWQEYQRESHLLFWSVIAIASRRYSDDSSLLDSLALPISKLVWSSIQLTPQDYSVVKALCLLCTWPFPTSSTSTDPTFVWSGLMMHIAMQIGLHRPRHTQDFSKLRIELREEELKDRVKTWAACNIVAQSVATGYGQPPSTLYDLTLEKTSIPDSELVERLRIEKFCDRVTRSLYSNSSDAVGLADERQRPPLVHLLERELSELRSEHAHKMSTMNQLYLLAAQLHLRLSVFFDSSLSPTHQYALLDLYQGAIAFLELVILSPNNILQFCTGYIFQMTVAAGFALLKLLNSQLTTAVDFQAGKQLFHETVKAIRTISVLNNDLPSRLAEVLAQLWRGGSASSPIHGSTAAAQQSASSRELQLKVRCRMSMSLVYDSIWRWREEFQAKGRGNLDVANPTNPDPNADSSDTIPNHTMATLPLSGADSLGGAGGLSGYEDGMYEVFDPLNWMLDGLVDLPYALGGTGLDSQMA